MKNKRSDFSGKKKKMEGDYRAMKNQELYLGGGGLPLGGKRKGVEGEGERKIAEHHLRKKEKKP